MNPNPTLSASQQARLAEAKLPGARAVFKFNGGRGAVLCSVCSTIVQQGSQIDWVAYEAGELKPIFCSDHRNL